MHIATQHGICAANQERISASIVEYRLKTLFALVGFFDAAIWLPVLDLRNKYTPRTL
jgi:hypothetical protein